MSVSDLLGATMIAGAPAETRERTTISASYGTAVLADRREAGDIAPPGHKCPELSRKRLWRLIRPAIR